MLVVTFLKTNQTPFITSWFLYWFTTFTYIVTLCTVCITRLSIPFSAFSYPVASTLHYEHEAFHSWWKVAKVDLAVHKLGDSERSKDVPMPTYVSWKSSGECKF